jgi:mannose/cellobiose epimerase-like protein (N-acyl-D-glucosamine 2-epimerase family)
VNRDSSNSLRLSFALSHAATTPIDNMDDHELRQLRIECVNELKSFVSFFNIGGVDHTHGGFCCGLSHAGKRLTDQKFVWFNGRGIWTYARLHRSGLLAHEPAPPHDDAHSDGMQGYLLQVAERTAS